MQHLAVKETGISGIQFNEYRLATHIKCRLNSCPRCIPLTPGLFFKLQAAQPMRPAKYLQTAVFAGCRIDGDKAGHQIRKRTPWTIISILTVWITPVQEVLVPQKAITSTETTAKRFFGIQMVVIKRLLEHLLVSTSISSFEDEAT